ncbi:MAG: hypothetical protein WCW13_03375 [archaeon]
MPDKKDSFVEAALLASEIGGKKQSVQNNSVSTTTEKKTIPGTVTETRIVETNISVKKKKSKKIGKFASKKKSKKVNKVVTKTVKSTETKLLPAASTPGEIVKSSSVQVTVEKSVEKSPAEKRAISFEDSIFHPKGGLIEVFGGLMMVLIAIQLIVVVGLFLLVLFLK